MSFFGDVLGFEKNLLGQRVSTWKKQPERLIFGINSPADTAVWGKITGKKYEPMFDMWGSPTGKQYETAQASGINTGAGKGMHDLAKVIASAIVGGKMMGGGGGGGGGGGSPNGMFNNLPMPNLGGGQQQQNQQQVMPPVPTNQYIINPNQQWDNQQPMNPNFMMANALRNYYV